jgi:hemerythrin
MARPATVPQDRATTRDRVTADWTEAMSVGVDLLDAHHRHIWRRIRHVANAVSAGRADEVRAALRFLHTYLVAHHFEEEEWMLEAGYPGAREHVRLHAEIVDRVRCGSEAGQPDAKALFETADWAARMLQAHMRLEDLKLGRFFTARENLRRLAESGPGVGAALTPLPGSLGTVEPRREALELEPVEGAAGTRSGER